jgi:cell division protein FtsQ
VAARRAEGRRRLRVVVVVVCVVAALALAWGVTKSPLFGVDKIVVRGNSHASTAEVEQASGVHDGDSLVWLHPGDVAERVERSPWVRTADVRRDWPRTLVITVTERSPVAWVADGSGAWLVDTTGRVLVHADAPPATLPQLLGVHGGSQPGASVSPSAGAGIAAVYGPYEAAIAHVEMRGGDAFVVLRSGIEIRMGPPTQVRAKLAAANAVITALGATPPTYVDVSVPTNPVAG